MKKNYKTSIIYKQNTSAKSIKNKSVRHLKMIISSKPFFFFDSNIKSSNKKYPQQKKIKRI